MVADRAEFELNHSSTSPPAAHSTRHPPFAASGRSPTGSHEQIHRHASARHLRRMAAAGHADPRSTRFAEISRATSPAFDGRTSPTVGAQWRPTTGHYFADYRLVTFSAPATVGGTCRRCARPAYDYAGELEARLESFSLVPGHRFSLAGWLIPSGALLLDNMLKLPKRQWRVIKRSSSCTATGWYNRNGDSAAWPGGLRLDAGRRLGCFGKGKRIPYPHTYRRRAGSTIFSRSERVCHCRLGDPCWRSQEVAAVAKIGAGKSSQPQCAATGNKCTRRTCLPRRAPPATEHVS